MQVEKTLFVVRHESEISVESRVVCVELLNEFLFSHSALSGTAQAAREYTHKHIRSSVARRVEVYAYRQR